MKLGMNVPAGNSPPDTGGVAAPSRKRSEATPAAQTGWLALTKYIDALEEEGEESRTCPEQLPLKHSGMAHNHTFVLTRNLKSTLATS